MLNRRTAIKYFDFDIAASVESYIRIDTLAGVCIVRHQQAVPFTVAAPTGEEALKIAKGIVEKLLWDYNLVALEIIP